MANLDEYQTIILASLLHDIGKFWQSPESAAPQLPKWRNNDTGKQAEEVGTDDEDKIPVCGHLGRCYLGN